MDVILMSVRVGVSELAMPISGKNCPSMTERVIPKPGFSRELFSLAAALITVLALVAFSSVNAVQIQAQSQDEAAVARLPQFEVVSIKPHKPSSNGSSYGSPTADGYSGVNLTVGQLISKAYDIRGSGQVSGLPEWADEERFDVEAKLNDDAIAAFQKLSGPQQWEQAALMLRPLLADRFKLQAHHETKELPVYALVIAKGGFKLQPSKEPENLGGMVTNRGSIYIRGGPIGARFIVGLSNATGRIVIDKTGLTGYYDIDFKWTPDEDIAAGVSGPSLFTALEEQLGLKLVPAKAPVDVLVVDHVEKPTPN